MKIKEKKRSVSQDAYHLSLEFDHEVMDRHTIIEVGSPYVSKVSVLHALG